MTWRLVVATEDPPREPLGHSRSAPRAKPFPRRTFNTPEKSVEETARKREPSIANPGHKTCSRQSRAERRCPAMLNTERIANAWEAGRCVRDQARGETRNASAE